MGIENKVMKSRNAWSPSALAFVIFAMLCGGISHAQMAPPLDRAAVTAGPYNLAFFRNPPMLTTDGTEQAADMNSLDLTWSTIPAAFELAEPLPFELPSGETHWYQTVYLAEGGVNWVQAQSLAEQKGGYLISLHSQEENDFAFSLVSDEKYWRKFPYGEKDDGSPLFNLSGPFLGGYQYDGAQEPGGGWAWVSGEPMTWTNWLQEGQDVGIHIAPDNQPNNSARGAQNVLAFGEVDVPASYWCDVSHLMGTYGSGRLASHGFIIEYNSNPNAPSSASGSSSDSDSGPIFKYLGGLLLLTLVGMAIFLMRRRAKSP